MIDLSTAVSNLASNDSGHEAIVLASVLLISQQAAYQRRIESLEAGLRRAQALSDKQVQDDAETLSILSADRDLWKTRALNAAKQRDECENADHCDGCGYVAPDCDTAREHEVSELREIVEQQRDDKHFLMQQVEAYSKELTSLRNDKHLLLEEIRSRGNDLVELRAKYERAQEELGEQDAKLVVAAHELQTKCESLLNIENAYKAIVAERDDLQLALGSTKSDNKTLDDINDYVERQLQAMTAQRDTMQQELTDLRGIHDNAIKAIKNVVTTVGKQPSDYSAIGVIEWLDQIIEGLRKESDRGTA